MCVCLCVCVQLKVGSYTFTVGYLKYEVTRFDNDQNRNYVIGGACGLAGLILLIIIIVIVVVCCRKRRKRQQQRPTSMMNPYLYDDGAGIHSISVHTVACKNLQPRLLLYTVYIY